MDDVSESAAMSELIGLRLVSRPLHFHTDIPEAPVSTWGSCFLVGFRGRVFVVTAAHLIKNLDSSFVAVFPHSEATKALRLRNGFKWQRGRMDEYDLIVYEVVLEYLSAEDRARSNVLRLDATEAIVWRANAFTSLFFFSGYPSELNDVDYDEGLINTQQVLMSGQYIGPSVAQPTIHQIKVRNPTKLRAFGGFSGSPVLALDSKLGDRNVISVAGMAIWGSSKSGMVHFIESAVILELLTMAIHYWGGNMPPYLMRDGSAP